MAQRAAADDRDGGDGFGEPGHGASGEESVGTILARTRMEYGQELTDVAGNLRIRRVYLQAIEDGRYAELPGATYAVGFVRSYADYLGLDSGTLVERFRSEIAGIDRRQELQFPAPKPEGRIPGGALVLVSLLLIAVVYGGWSYLNREGLLDGALPQDAVPTAALPDNPLADDPPAGESDAATDGARTAARDASGSAVTRATEGRESGPNGAGERGVDPAGPPPEAVADAVERDESDETLPGDAPSGAAATTDAAPQAEPAGAATGQVAGEAAPLPTTPEPPVGAAPEPVAAETAEPAGGPSGGAPSSEAAGRAARGPAPAAASEGTPAVSVEPAPETAGPAEPAATQAETATEPTAEPAAAAPAPDAGAATAEATAGQASQQAGGGENAPQADAGDSAIPAAPDLPPQVASATGRVYGAVNTDSRITLTATADSWVQVRSADDNLLITRVLREGDVYRVPNEDGLTLETGNAGGLEITVDGRTAPPLGASGDVLRGVSLQPQALLNGTATD